MHMQIRVGHSNTHLGYIHISLLITVDYSANRMNEHAQDGSTDAHLEANKALELPAAVLRLRVVVACSPSPQYQSI
jgi:hypothetical protein